MALHQVSSLSDWRLSRVNPLRRYPITTPPSPPRRSVDVSIGHALLSQRVPLARAASPAARAAPSACVRFAFAPLPLWPPTSLPLLPYAASPTLGGGARPAAGKKTAPCRSNSCADPAQEKPILKVIPDAPGAAPLGSVARLKHHLQQAQPTVTLICSTPGGACQYNPCIPGKRMNILFGLSCAGALAEGRSPEPFSAGRSWSERERKFRALT